MPSIYPILPATQAGKSDFGCLPTYLMPFALTKFDGNIITNAVLIKLTPNKFIYKTPNGEEGIMRLDSLSKDLQKRFGYDAEDAASADSDEAWRKSKQTAAWQQQQAIAADQERRNIVLQKALKNQYPVNGRAIQKKSDGLLVSLDLGDYEHRTILLVNYQHEDSVAADDRISCRAFRLGLYTYTTVNNSENTIHIFNCSTNDAIDYYSSH